MSWRRRVTTALVSALAGALSLGIVPTAGWADEPDPGPPVSAPTHPPASPDPTPPPETPAPTPEPTTPTPTPTEPAPEPPVQVMVTFRANGGKFGTATTRQATFTAGDPLTITEPTRDRQNFLGWFTKASGGIRITHADPKLTTVYAQWKKTTKLTIVFDPAGGTVSPARKTVTYGKKYGTLPKPKRAGYSFSGWYTRATGGSKVSTKTKANTKAARITLHARWKASVKVTFDANGGTVSKASKVVTVGGKYGSLPTPKRSRYSFMGWYTAKQHGGSKVTSGTKASVRTTLYARWAPKPVYQSDPKWRNRRYRNTIGGSGCGPTAMTIVVKAIGNGGSKTTPVTAANYSMKHGYASSNYHPYAKTHHDFFFDYGRKYGLTITRTTSDEEALQAVRDGNWVIAQMTPGYWTRHGHYIVWYDIAGDRALVRDPNGTKASKTRNTIKNLQRQAKYYLIVEVPDSKKLYSQG